MNLLFSSINNQLLIIILLFSLIIFIKRYKNFLYKSISTADNTENLFKYLDKYYIKNKLFTIICVFFYILGNLSIFFFIRIKSPTKSNNLFIGDNLMIESFNMLSFTNMLTSLILFIIIIILYRVLLNKMFFDEVLKLHIYLKTHKYYIKVLRFLTKTYFIEFFGKYYLFLFNISKGRIITSNSIQDAKDFDIYSDIYDSPKIIRLSSLLVKITKQSYFLLLFFKVLREVFGFLYFHIRLRGFIPYIPYIILPLSLFYDFLHLKICYTYYISFIVYFFFHLFAGYKLLYQ